MNLFLFFKELYTQLFEKVSIVNEKNEVTGSMARIFSFLFKKSHRGVNVLIFKDDTCKEILIEKRQWWMRFPLKKGDCSGAVPFPLSYEQTAYKEIHEELFYNRALPKISLKKIAEFKDTTAFPFIWSQVFIGVYPGPFSPSFFEVRGLKFISIEKIKSDLNHPKESRKYSPSFREAFRHFVRISS